MDANSDIIQKYKKMAEKIIGEEIDITHMNGATDARMFAEKSCIIMHMISGGEAHSIDEYVELSSIKKFYEIQKEFIKSL